MRKLLTALLLLLLFFAAGAEDAKIPVQARRHYIKDYHTEKAVTVDGLEGFVGSDEPETDAYGGYLVANLKATGFFRTEKVGGRWWIVTPDGHPFIFKGVATVSSKGSDNMKQTVKEKFGDVNGWAEHTVRFLRESGFNGAGAWSDANALKKCETEKFPYCVIISPLKKFEHKVRKGFKDSQVAFIFDDGLEDAVAAAMKTALRYKDDPWCVGYFIDNEIPWKNTLLEFYLNDLPKGDPNRTAAEKWMKKRKGRAKAPVSIEDRERFAAYVFEYYQKMALGYLREYDADHMYLGCRFNAWPDELSNRYIFEAAGKYMDIISVNHYGRWEPYWRRFDKWEEWSGRPAMVTEFYTKGADTGMKNTSGAGWIVPTQKDRGVFYQNFVISLLKSPACVGWHWFKYADNDPENLKADPSNRDSNKGLVGIDFEPYEDLVKEMKAVNSRVYSLIQHFGNTPRKGGVCLIDDDFKKGKVDRYKEILDSLDIRCTFAATPDVGKEGGAYYSDDKMQKIKSWQHQGYSVVLHPVHQGWYNNKSKTITYGGEAACEASLKDNIAALKKTVAKDYDLYLVYPGSSFNNKEVVEMAGKYVKYGIGSKGAAAVTGGPVQLERIFISPKKHSVEEYKSLIRAAIEKDGYVILGTHSWEYKEATYPFLVEILSYVKTIAEFQTLQELLPSWVGQ